MTISSVDSIRAAMTGAIIAKFDCDADVVRSLAEQIADCFGAEIQPAVSRATLDEIVGGTVTVVAPFRTNDKAEKARQNLEAAATLAAMEINGRPNFYNVRIEADVASGTATISGNVRYIAPPDDMVGLTDMLKAAAESREQLPGTGRGRRLGKAIQGLLSRIAGGGR
jgi:hypothetical protein